MPSVDVMLRIGRHRSWMLIGMVCPALRHDFQCELGLVLKGESRQQLIERWQHLGGVLPSPG